MGKRPDDPEFSHRRALRVLARAAGRAVVGLVVAAVGLYLLGEVISFIASALSGKR